MAQSASAFRFALTSLLTGALIVGLVALPAAAARAEDPPAKPAPGDPPNPPDPAKPADPAKPGDPPPADPAKPDPAKPDPAAGVPPPAAQPPKIPLKDAWSELSRLIALVKDNKKSDNGDIIAAIDAVSKAYHNLAPDQIADASGAMVADEKNFEAGQEKFWKAADGAFLDAYELDKVKASIKANERDDVNVRAAVALGQTRPEVTQKFIMSFQKVLKEAKEYEPPTALYDETFKGLALLNEQKFGLPWMLKEWIKYSSSGHDPEIVKAAFDGIILYKEVPGKMRFDIVDKIVTFFAGIESSAQVNKSADEQSKKKVWDKIKTSVVKALQAYTKEATLPDGKTLLSTVAGFQDWLRDNKYSPKKDPWADPKDPK